MESGLAGSHEARGSLPGNKVFWLNPLAGFLSSALVSFTSVWLFFSELQNGKLGLIDDHEYLSYLGPDRIIAWGEISKILSETEVGSWGESTRFRPGYYLFRILQTKFFLGDAYLWYSSRLVLFAFALFLLGLTLWALVGRVLRVTPLSSGAVTLFQFGVMTWATMALVSLGSWEDIVTRLGPSELFVFLGLSLMCFGLTLINSGLRSWVGNAVANFGFILAVTSKENAFLLIVPLVLFTLIQIRRDGFARLNLTMVIVSTLVGAWVISGILLAVSRSGTDMYGERRTITGFLVALGGDPRSLFVSFLAFTVVVIELVISRNLVTRSRDKARDVLEFASRYPLSLMAFSAIFVFLGEHYFYQNSLAADVFQPGRYGMGTELAMVVMSLTIVFLALSSIGVLKKSVTTIGLRVVSFLLAFALIYGSSGTISWAAANYPNVSKGAVAQNVQQMVIIESMAKSLESAPEMQVLILADEPFDYERVWSLPIFLDFYAGRQVSFYLKTQIPEELKLDNFFRGLSNRLDEISLNGGWKLLPIREFDSEKQTLCIYFGQLVELEFCTITMGLD